MAVVNLFEDYKSKDYGFALYDDDFYSAHVGDYVIVNPLNKPTVGVIKHILTITEYGKNVTKEVMGICDTYNYQQRVAKREFETQQKRRKNTLLKSINERINIQKDMNNYEFYNFIAEKYGEKDTELLALVKELNSLGEVEEK